MALDNAYPTAATALTTMTQWEAFFVGMGVGTGIVAGLNGELAPSINSGARTVSIGTGAAVERGFYVNNAATTTLNVPAQSAGNRVDRLVLRLDRTAVTAAAWVTAVIIQGTSGSTTPPAVQATTNASWDLTVCRWTTNSNGTLSGLVDERYFLGGGYTEFSSTARPSASPPRIGRERDTGRLLVANGSTWTAVLPDSGVVNVAAVAHWDEGAFVPRVRKIGSICYLKGDVVRKDSKLAASDDDSGCLQLPAGYYPSESHNWVGFSGGTACRMKLDTDGLVHVMEHPSDINVGSAVYLDTVYMV